MTSGNVSDRVLGGLGVDRLIYHLPGTTSLRLLVIRILLVLPMLCTGFTTNLLAHIVPEATQLNAIDSESPFGISGATEYTDVWAEGDFAYIGSDNAGVAKIGVGASTPTLSHVDTYAPTGHADFLDVKVLDGIGYFSGSQGTDIVDTTLPLNSQQVTRIDATIGGHTSVRNVAVGNGYLFQVSSESPDIHVFDIANPTSPRFVRTINTQDSDGIADVTLLDDQLYAAGIGDATYWYDVSEIGSQFPQLNATIPTGSNASSAWPADDGNLLMVTHRELGGKLEAWDISEPSNPDLLFTADPSIFGFSSYSTSEVVAVGSLAYVAWYQGGLEVIDIEDVATFGLQRLGFYVNNSGPISAGFIDIHSVFPLLGPDRILASHTQFGLYAIDATPLDPQLIGDYDNSGTVDSGDYAYWKNAFGTDDRAADGNRNGIVDAADYTVWLSAMGDTIPPLPLALPIPEPSSQTLGIVFTLIALTRTTLNRNR